jgi:hypothetical protein
MAAIDAVIALQLSASVIPGVAAVAQPESREIVASGRRIALSFILVLPVRLL